MAEAEEGVTFRGAASAGESSEQIGSVNKFSFHIERILCLGCFLCRLVSVSLPWKREGAKRNRRTTEKTYTVFPEKICRPLKLSLMSKLVLALTV